MEGKEEGSMRTAETATSDIEQAPSRDEESDQSPPAGGTSDSGDEGAPQDDSFDVDAGLPDRTSRSEPLMPSQRKNRLSTTSQFYDRGNKGYLDPTEQRLREMDSENLGHLDVDKVYKIMQNFQSEQKKATSLKWTVIALSIFATLLALSNIGTSFAAATLAKDTSVSTQGMLLIKGTNETVGVNTRTEVFRLVRDEELSNADPQQRHLTANNDVFQVNFAKMDIIFNKVCSKWGTVNNLKTANYDGSSFDCQNQGSAKVSHCDSGYQTTLAFTQNPWLVQNGAKIRFKLRNVDRGGMVFFTCDKSTGKCTTSNLECVQECSVYARWPGNQQRPLTWYCPENKYCGCNPCDRDNDSGNDAVVGCSSSDPPRCNRMGLWGPDYNTCAA